MSDIVKKILELMKRSGDNAHSLETKAGLPNASIQTWKNGKSKPSSESVMKLANYFGVSTDYLFGIQENIYDTSVVLFNEIATVRAGYDGTAEEIPTGKTIEIPVSMLKGRKKEEYFVLHVVGNSMYPRLLEGDSILCLRTSSVDSGDYAVVLYDSNEATVKKVNYVFGENWLELIPCNPEYPTKLIKDKDLENCRILGKVVKLIRDL